MIDYNLHLNRVAMREDIRGSYSNRMGDLF